MSDQAKVLALSVEANIYEVIDHRGKSLGTGTKEVCEILARIASFQHLPSDVSPPQPRLSGTSATIRSAIII